MHSAPPDVGDALDTASANLGYLEDRELTVAPRVVTDLALDLAWLSRS